MAIWLTRAGKFGEYENKGHLISTLSAGVIEPAERKVQEIRGK